MYTFEKENIYKAIGRINEFSGRKSFKLIDLFDYDEWLVMKNKKETLSDFGTLINLCAESLGVAIIDSDENPIKVSYKIMDNSTSVQTLRTAISNIGYLILKTFKEKMSSNPAEYGAIQFNFRHLFNYHEWSHIEDNEFMNLEEKFIEIIDKTDVLGIKKSDKFLDYKIVF